MKSNVVSRLCRDECGDTNFVIDRVKWTELVAFRVSEDSWRGFVSVIEVYSKGDRALQRFLKQGRLVFTRAELRA